MAKVGAVQCLACVICARVQMWLRDAELNMDDETYCSGIERVPGIHL